MLLSNAQHSKIIYAVFESCTCLTTKSGKETTPKSKRADKALRPVACQGILYEKDVVSGEVGTESKPKNYSLIRQILIKTKNMCFFPLTYY